MADDSEQDVPNNEPPDEAPGGPDAPENGSRRLHWAWDLLGTFATLLLAGLAVLPGAFGIQPGAIARYLFLVGTVGLATATFLKHLHDHPIMSRRGRWISFFTAISTVAFLTLAAVFRQHSASETFRMTGGPNIAVVGFESTDGRQDQRVLDGVSKSLADALMPKNPPDGIEAHDYAPTTSPPLRELARAQNDHHRLDRWAADFADDANAGIVIGGLVSTAPSGRIEVRPVVYVRADKVVDAPELAGWYRSSEPIRLDQDLRSETGPKRLKAELVRRTEGLAAFTHALDLWQAGLPSEAKATLDSLLATGSRDDTEFVAADLIRLFHGHVLEQIAVKLPAHQRRPDLEAANADYQAIDQAGPIGKRARLSTAGLTYLLALGSSPSCHPGTVDGNALAQASIELRQLAADAGFADIGRLRAWVNLARVEQCRTTAQLVSDDGTIDNALHQVRAAADSDAVKPLKALAASIEAEHAAGRGDLAGAIVAIKEAIVMESYSARAGLWQALATTWEFERGDLASACSDMQEAVIRLKDAKANGQITPQRYDELTTPLQQQAQAAGSPCPNASSRT